MKTKRRPEAPMQPESRARRRQWTRPAMEAALVVLVLLAYSNSFQAGFTLDNHGILRDPRVQQATAHNVRLIADHTYWWPSGESGLYRPLTTLSYLFNYAILGDGDQPGGYHWVNLTLHAINVLLLFALLLRWMGDSKKAGLIAAAWAVHPVLTESVTNIVGRADLLAAAATLGGLLMYLKITEARGWTRAAWILGLMSITFGGVFSKESAVCVLGVIVAYELIRPAEGASSHGESTRRVLIMSCAATAIPIVAMLTQRSKVLAASLPAEFPFTDNPIVGASFWIGRLTALKVIARYLWLLVWPAKLSSDYSYAEIPLFRGTLGDVFSCAIAVLAIALSIYMYKRNRLACFFLCFAGVTFFPMSNLALPIGTIMAERFLYLPSIGIVGCLVLAIFWICERFGVAKIAPVAVCLTILCLAIRTWARNADWLDDRSITVASLDASPNSFKLHRLMAALIYGEERTPENIRRGKEEAEKSVALIEALPDAQSTAEPYCLAAGYDFLEGEFENAGTSASLSGEALAAYEEGIARAQRCAAIDKAVHAEYLAKLPPGMLAPEGDPQPYLMLSSAYIRMGDTGKAVGAAREALRLYPRSAAGYLQVANVFMNNHLREDAASALTEGLLLTSASGLADALSTIYQDAGATCGVVETAAGRRMNPGCAPYRERVCEISADVLKARLEMSRRDLAEEQRQEFVQTYGCPAAPLDATLRDR
jgi:tetratricopeptide (TPR) repeat protein